MASNNESDDPLYIDSSSEDECLSVIKRKADYSSDNDKNQNTVMVSEMLVTVEIEEVEDDEADADFKIDHPTTSKKKKPKLRKPRSFPCSMCDAVFQASADLKKHSLEHQVKTRHKCDECGRYFKKAFSLRLHVQSHSMEKNIKCPLCDLTFGFKAGLTRHLATRHEKTEECDRCPAKFHTKEQLNQHVATHVGELTCEQVPNIRKSQYLVKSDISDQETDLNTSEKSVIKNEAISSEDSNDPNYKSEVEVPKSIQEGVYLTRQDLTNPTQCAIVSKMHKGRTVADICSIYNLTPEVVNEIWEDRDKYDVSKKVGKKSTKYMNSVLDARIVDWFHSQKANDIQISGKMLQDTAEAFAKEFGFIAFNGSRKWLDRFKKRYNISLRGTPTKRDYGNMAESKWKKQFFNETWDDARHGVNDEDIYTADEVGLFYNPSKGRVKKLGGKKFVQGYAKDRLAVFMCVNVPGTDKKKLLVCGTEDPLVHSYRDPDTLPVTYIRHCQGHFTTQMFEEYVKYWNRELQINNRKAVLILDRAAIHSKLKLSHLKLVFVPWKASSGLMPIKNGIFASFREEYRRLFLEEKAMNVLRGVDRNMTCLEALNMLEKAWERMSGSVVNRCFVNLGYDVKPIEETERIIPKVYDGDEEMLCTVLKDYDVESYFTDIPNIDMYLTVDEELLTGVGTNCSVFGGSRKVNDPLNYAEKEKEEILPIATDKPETDEKEAKVKKLRALQDLEIVRKYLQSNETPYELYCKFMEIEKFVVTNDPVYGADSEGTHYLKFDSIKVMT